MDVTLVISDLHLGTVTGADVARLPAVRDRLAAALADVGRLVIAGDAIELRQRPLRDAFAAAAPFFAAVGRALGGDGEVVLVPGNHDHALLAPWFERRRRIAAPPPLGFDQTVSWERGDPLSALAEMVAPARLTVAYPGVWLRPGTYVTHGHYLDRHTAIPTVERLSAEAMGRIVGAVPTVGAVAEEYEAALAPIYAWSYALAQQEAIGGEEAIGGATARSAGPQAVSVRVWQALAGDGRRSWRRRTLAALFPFGIAAANRGGFGPFSADLSRDSLGGAGVAAMAAVLAAMEVPAREVIFGHIHRAGPVADDPLPWSAPGRPALYNAGSWVYEEQFLTGASAASPYWPGHALELAGTAPPRLRPLLADLPRSALVPR